MGIPVLILGESGSGKSTSMRNFEPDEIGVFNVAGKPFPFRKKLPAYNNAGYDLIYARLPRRDQNGNFPEKYRRAYVIDDSQYLMAFASFARAKEKGYGKFTDFAVDFFSLIHFVVNEMPPDCIVYFLNHVETGENGMIKIKTVGKMLDSQLTVEGLFSIVLLCRATKDRHCFITQSEGISTAKSPMGMFQAEIDNDLKSVDTTIREYWGLAPLTGKKKEEKTENKEEKPDVAR